MVKYPIFLLTLLTLCGCSTKEFHLGWYDKCLPKTVITIKKVYPIIDEDKLTCTKIPKPPLMSKQSEVANYLVDLTISGKQCENNLNYVKILFNKFKQVDSYERNTSQHNSN